MHWDDVEGLSEVKQLLYEMVQFLLTKPEWFTRLGISPSKEILLYGPLGMGKTMIVQVAAT